MTVTLCLFCSPDVGVYSIGAFRGPPRLGVAFPTTSGLYCLEVCWQLHRGFPSAPSVGCGLPYHIWSLLSRILLATALGFSEVPLGRVWPSLPHLVSNSLGVCWQLHWDPNSTELNNNSTPTRSPTGSLNRMFNRHQAEKNCHAVQRLLFSGASLLVAQWDLHLVPYHKP